VDILELIMNNWWLLLALLWFFAGALGKKGKQKQEQQREQQIEHQRDELDNYEPSVSRSDETDFKEQQASIEFPWEKIGQAPQRQETYTRPEPQEIKKNVTKKVVDHLQNNQLVRKEIGNEIGQGTKIISPNDVNYSKKAKQLLDFETLDGTKVVQGMVWSQIFGKPRSKEPHRASMYSRTRRR
jgi:hypothetical protein